MILNEMYITRVTADDDVPALSKCSITWNSHCTFPKITSHQQANYKAKGLQIILILSTVIRFFLVAEYFHLFSHWLF